MKNKKGFTLIELLVVISIIGILAAIILVSLISGRERAKVAAFKEQVKSIHTSAVYYSDDAGVINAATLRAKVGALPSGVVWNTILPQSADGVGNFILCVDSENLIDVCTATMTETGITVFTGC